MEFFFLFNLKTLRRYLMRKDLKSKRMKLGGEKEELFKGRKVNKVSRIFGKERRNLVQYTKRDRDVRGKVRALEKEAPEGSRSYICRTAGGCQRARQSPSGVSATRIATGTPRVRILTLSYRSSSRIIQFCQLRSYPCHVLDGSQQSRAAHDPFRIESSPVAGVCSTLMLIGRKYWSIYNFLK